MKKKFVCFVAGKSGGHLLPCLTTAKKIVEQHPTTNILFFTTQTKLDQALLGQYKFIQEHYTLPLTALSNKKFFSYVTFIATGIYSFFMSLAILYKKKPEKIMSMGGAISLPVCLAGALLRIPIELIELNAIPGKALQTLAPFATSISVCFKEAQKHFTQKCYTTIYPLRFTKSDSIQSTTARNYLGLDLHKKTIFIVGGSQGSLFINNCIKRWVELNKINLDSVQIIHQIGHQDSTDWKKFYHIHGIDNFIFSFYHNIQYCYNAADFIVCRSGAGTLFEVSFFNKPCITIPLETAQTTHQRNNADAFKKMYGTQVTVLYQKEITQCMQTFNDVLTKNLSL